MNTRIDDTNSSLAADGPAEGLMVFHRGREHPRKYHNSLPFAQHAIAGDERRRAALKHGIQKLQPRGYNSTACRQSAPGNEGAPELAHHFSFMEDLLPWQSCCSAVLAHESTLRSRSVEGGRECFAHARFDSQRCRQWPLQFRPFFFCPELRKSLCAGGW